MAVPRGPDDPTDDLPDKNVPDPVVETEADETQPEGSVLLQDHNIRDREFRYNPPIHNANRFHVTGRDRISLPGKDAVDFYDEAGAPRNYAGAWADKNLNSLRLGRIIQHHVAPGHVYNLKYRWGFRFLYNPSSITFAASRNNSFVLDGRSESNRVISGINQNFQTITLKLLLDRVPDVMAKEIKSSDYSPRLRGGDAAGLRRYGTHWDLEALYKVCNGNWELTDRGSSSNIGVLIPSNARLILGKGDNLYGFVESVQYRDVMFSSNMVPIRTEVSLTFRRHVDMSPEQVETSFPGLGTVDYTGTAGGSEGSTPGAPSGDSGSVGNNKDAPLPGYNKVTTGFYGYKDHNGWDYGMAGVKNQPIHACYPGRIHKIQYLTYSYGYHVWITNGNVDMIYAHMSYINPRLKVGALVNTGDWLGRVGETGNASGNHLHYEERLKGVPRIPIYAENTGSIR